MSLTKIGVDNRSEADHLADLAPTGGIRATMSPKVGSQIHVLFCLRIGPSS